MVGRAHHRRRLRPRRPGPQRRDAGQHRAVPRDHPRPARRRPPGHPTPGPRRRRHPAARSPRLLNGIGYVFIVRLDEAQDDGRPLAGLQALWTARRHRRLHRSPCRSSAARRDLERYRYTFAAGRHRPARCCRWSRSSAARSTGRGSGSRSGRSTSSRARPPRSSSPSSSPATWWSGASCWRCRTFRLGPLHLPDPKHLGPIAARLGRLARGHDAREGPGLVAAVLRPVHGHALGRHRAHRPTWPSAPRCSSPAPPSPTPSSPTCRTGSRCGSTPWPVRQDEGFQVVEAAFAFADGGIAGTGIGLGTPTRIPEVETDFIFAAIGEELGLLGATAILCAYLLMVGAGLRIALRADSAVRHAARRRPHHPARHPGVHHHRRRHPGPAAHRRDPAVRQLRRLVPGRQLRPARAAAADLGQQRQRRRSATGRRRRRRR